MDCKSEQCPGCNDCDGFWADKREEESRMNTYLIRYVYAGDFRRNQFLLVLGEKDDTVEALRERFYKAFPKEEGYEATGIFVQVS